MNEDIGLLRLQDSWRECERHLHHLSYAIKSLNLLLPLTSEQYLQLTDEQIQDIDQFILRFTKLQDAMGSRFFPAILMYLKEPYEDRPMIDRLNRLEALGYLEDAREWLSLRVLRNKLSHEYLDNIEKNVETLNLSFSSAMCLHAILDQASIVLLNKNPTLYLGESLPPI